MIGCLGLFLDQDRLVMSACLVAQQLLFSWLEDTSLASKITLLGMTSFCHVACIIRGSVRDILSVRANRSIKLSVFRVLYLIPCKLASAADGTDFNLVSWTVLVTVDVHHLLSGVVNVLGHTLVLLAQVAVLFVNHVVLRFEFDFVVFLVESGWHRLFVLAHHSCWIGCVLDLTHSHLIIWIRTVGHHHMVHSADWACISLVC